MGAPKKYIGEKKTLLFFITFTFCVNVAVFVSHVLRQQSVQWSKVLQQKLFQSIGEKKTQIYTTNKATDVMLTSKLDDQ